MRVYDRGKGRGWSVDYFFGGRRIRLKAGSSEKAAKALRLRIETEIAAGTHDPQALVLDLKGIAPAQQNFEELVKAFLEQYASGRRSEYYLHLSKPLKAAFGSQPAKAIDREGLLKYVKDRRQAKRAVCDNTIRKELTVLGTILRWADLPLPPLHLARPPKPPKRSIAFLASEQEGALLPLLAGVTADVVEWAIYSGMRRGEILRLEWKDLDQARGLINVLSGKTGQARIIPLALSLRLRAILARRPRPIAGGLVFAERNGSTLDPWSLNRVVEAAAETAQIPRERGVMFNLFRHTFATRLAATGRASLFEIAQWMGNSVSVCERHYAAYLPGSSQKAAGLLDTTGPAAPPAPINHLPGGVLHGTPLAPAGERIA